MPHDFLDRLTTPGVEAAQTANGARALWARLKGARRSDAFTGAEAAFIAARDSLYMATISQSGWPYVQHRGGPPGFVKVLDERTFAFADFAGNRQYISLGNFADDDRAALILVDYPSRTRLKILARVRVRGLGDDPALAAALVAESYRARPERLFRFTLGAFDWNCPQHITPRFTATEIEAAVAPMRARLETLEAENVRLTALVKETRP